jgi:hypothetical protein
MRVFVWDTAGMAEIMYESVADFLKTALELKEEGNKLYKEKQYRPALAKYGKVHLYVAHFDVAIPQPPPPRTISSVCRCIAPSSYPDFFVSRAAQKDKDGKVKPVQEVPVYEPRPGPNTPTPEQVCLFLSLHLHESQLFYFGSARRKRQSVSCALALL